MSAPVRSKTETPRASIARHALRFTVLSAVLAIAGAAVYVSQQTQILSVSFDAASHALIQQAGAEPVAMPPPRSNNAATLDDIERAAATFREIVMPFETTQTIARSDELSFPLALRIEQERLAAFDEHVLIENLPTSARVEPAERVDEHTWAVDIRSVNSVRISLGEPARDGFAYTVKFTDQLRAARVAMTVRVSIAAPPQQANPVEPRRLVPKPAAKPDAARMVPSSSEAPSKPAKRKIVVDEPRPARKAVEVVTRSSLGASQVKAKPEPAPAPAPVQWWQRPAPAWSGELKAER